MASQMTVISSFAYWPCTMPVSRHSCEDPYILVFWGKMNKIVDYPTDMEPVDESVKKIKEYFKIG